AQAPDTGTLPADFTVNGEWTIYSVRDETVTGEERPYITFDLAANRFYGSNGCNIINGNIKLGEKGAMRLSEVISTMKMCQDAPFEYLINVALDDVRSYTPRQEGSITFLDLKGASGNVTMVLRRHNMDFLNGAWKVLTLNGTPLEQEDDATMTINIPDLKIHGTTGCNIFNGTLFIDPDKRRSMQFADIATTRMMCPPDSRETEFLLALESVESARQTGENIITMYDNEGAELFTMERIPMRPDQESAE
ncbi:MAG: META domain-containing protein, partial [Muribaculaceae bacterium]|nr:META domain-containing protein [Muribaculaceae bacterium]